MASAASRRALEAQLAALQEELAVRQLVVPAAQVLSPVGFTNPQVLLKNRIQRFQDLGLCAAGAQRFYTKGARYTCARQ